MLVRCKIRERDNIERFGHTNYHFKPDLNGNLLCEVDDEEALRHFLSLEQYEPFDDEEAPGDKAEGDDDFFEEDTGTLPGLDPTYEELCELYKEKFGKAAHPATKYETLVAKLKE